MLVFNLQQLLVDCKYLVCSVLIDNKEQHWYVCYLLFFNGMKDKKETRKRKGSISFSPLKHCSVTFFIPCSNVIHHILKCCNNFLANFYLPISLLTKQEENKYRCERLPSNGKCESHLYVIPVNFPVFSYAKLRNLSLVCHLS